MCKKTKKSECFKEIRNRRNMMEKENLHSFVIVIISKKLL
jgi:hypothetical protein